MELRRRVLVIKGITRYNVLGKATDEVASGFRKRGYTVVMLDMNEKSDLNQVDEEVFNDYDFVFHFQAFMYTWLAADGTLLISHIKTPLLSWVVDDLIYHSERVQNLIYDNVYMFTVDHAMKQIAEQMNPFSKNMFFLLHGGFETWKEGEKKSIDVLFPGTLGKPMQWTDFTEEPLPIERFLADETIQRLNQFPQLSVRRALEQVLTQLGEELDRELLQELNNVICYVDSWVRYQCKYRILESLLKSNITVHVIGEGSDALVNQYSDCVVVHGAQDINEVINLMGKSKIIINPCPPVFEEGFHERVFTAMLSKAACFTPYSVYTQKKLGTRVEMIDMNNLSQMVDRIKEILLDFDEYSKQVLEGNYLYALENHTWEKRGEQIIDFFEGGCKTE